jgi:hypothetical protein
MQTIITKQGNILTGPENCIKTVDTIVVNKINGEYIEGNLEIEIDFVSAFKIEKERLFNPKISNEEIDSIKNTFAEQIKTENSKHLKLKVEQKAKYSQENNSQNAKENSKKVN